MFKFLFFVAVCVVVLNAKCYDEYKADILSTKVKNEIFAECYGYAKDSSNQECKEKCKIFQFAQQLPKCDMNGEELPVCKDTCLEFYKTCGLDNIESCQKLPSTNCHRGPLADQPVEHPPIDDLSVSTSFLHILPAWRFGKVINQNITIGGTKVERNSTFYCYQYINDHGSFLEQSGFGYIPKSCSSFNRFTDWCGIVNAYNPYCGGHTRECCEELRDFLSTSFPQICYDVFGQRIPCFNMKNGVGNECWQPVPIADNSPQPNHPSACYDKLDLWLHINGIGSFSGIFSHSSFSGFPSSSFSGISFSFSFADRFLINDDNHKSSDDMAFELF
eukprot:TRINITY_DN854_c1_g6_i1.p1 TRINITY_DN854_c1_g6~~TRINITY_DN854_c1_g6_i1.p1  ORF type:complete len:332 (-),score=104.23 TRINITY_DN854_c1_g6_i1:230-1225(-)